jgi:hypothetical protein
MRIIPRGVYKAPLSKRRKGRALRATPCTSPLVQRTGMSKQLLLVRVSVDRVGQRTTKHIRSNSPPDSRRSTGHNGVANAKGWKISFPASDLRFQLAIIKGRGGWWAGGLPLRGKAGAGAGAQPQELHHACAAATACARFPAWLRLPCARARSPPSPPAAPATAVPHPGAYPPPPSLAAGGLKVFLQQLYSKAEARSRNPTCRIYSPALPDTTDRREIASCTYL